MTSPLHPRCLPLACALLCAAAGLAQTPALQPSTGVLAHLLGTWSITGTTLGKPTTTGAEVSEQFGGAFLELHIHDPAGRNPYEARVFFGEKPDGTLVVHWLDGTGAETSQTLGTGTIAGPLVTLTFPYPDNTFRDRLTYDAAHDRWRLFIEMGPPDHPKVFSDWYFNRRTQPRK